MESSPSLDRAVTEIAEAAARAAGEAAPLERGEFVHTGSSSIVLLLGSVAVRVGRNKAAGHRILRAQHLVDALPELPFSVPRSVGRPLTEQGLTAVATMRLPGAPHRAGSGDPDVLRALLEAVAGIDVNPLRELLAHPRDFLGGDGWEQRLCDEVVPLFPQRWCEDAQHRAEALIALEHAGADGDEGRPVMRHGDLAGSNVLWEGGRVTGVLDWDLAALDDPAEDVASLAWWHGWELLPQLTDAPTARRAEVFRRSFPVQSVAFAHLHERDPARLAQSVGRSVQVLEREAAGS